MSKSRNAREGWYAGFPPAQYNAKHTRQKSHPGFKARPVSVLAALIAMRRERQRQEIRIGNYKRGSV